MLLFFLYSFLYMYKKVCKVTKPKVHTKGSYSPPQKHCSLNCLKLLA